MISEQIAALRALSEAIPAAPWKSDDPLGPVQTAGGENVLRGEHDSWVVNRSIAEWAVAARDALPGLLDTIAADLVAYALMRDAYNMTRDTLTAVQKQRDHLVSELAAEKELTADRFELFKGMQTEFAAEKEARQRAEREANEAEETSRDLAVSLGRLLAIERGARALVEALEEEHVNSCRGPDESAAPLKALIQLLDAK